MQNTYNGDEDKLLSVLEAIMEEVIHDPEVAQLVEEAQRECGTLTSEELRIKKGMQFTPQFYSFL